MTIGMIAVESPHPFSELLGKNALLEQFSTDTFVDMLLPPREALVPALLPERRSKHANATDGTVSLEEITSHLLQSYKGRQLADDFVSMVAAFSRDQRPKLNGEMAALPIVPRTGLLPLALADVSDYCEFLAKLPELRPEQLWQWFRSSWEEARVSSTENLSAQVTNPSGKKHGELRCLSFNICGSRLLFPLGSKVPNRQQRLVEGLMAANADLVALQEAWNKDARQIAEAAGYQHVAFADARAGLLGKSGLLTASHFPIGAVAFHAFQHRSGIEVFCRKGALFTEHALPSGLTLQVWNVHLASAPEGLNHTFTSTGGAALVRQQQIQELQGWVRERERPGAITLLMGDFNSDSDLGSLGLDLYRARYPEELRSHIGEELFNGVTFDPHNNPLAKGRLDEPERLDRVLLRNFSREAVAVGTQRLFNQPGEFLSDHSALCVDLAITH